MKKLFITMLLAQIISCGGQDCEDSHVSVEIINNSDKIIYFFGGAASPEIGGYNPLRSGDYFKLLPNSSKKDGVGRDRGCYEDLFKENNNKLYYLLFDEQVLLNNTWEDIRANDLVLKRYSFTLAEMQAAGWVIVYDGS